MSQPITQTMTLLCDVVQTLPVGMNLALLHLLWMMVSGRLLVSRGAVIPGLHDLGLPDAAVRRGWQALRRGGWSIGELIVNWEATVLHAGRWQPRYHAGYCAVAVDLTGFWRPRLQNCPTTHYDHRAGKALPAIVLGLGGRVGQIGQQRLRLPLAILRTEPTQPRETKLMTVLVAKFKELMQPQDIAVEAIQWWWTAYGQFDYPHAPALLILADGGGSNGYRTRLWKYTLQHGFVNPHGLEVTGCHYPTGASKWNPADHRLFSFISCNWAGQPLTSYDKMIHLIEAIRTDTGLVVKATLTRKVYLTKIKISKEQMAALTLNKHATLPQWNYTIKPLLKNR